MRREHALTVRLSPRERSVLRDAARAHHVTVSDLVRAMVARVHSMTAHGERLAKRLVAPVVIGARFVVGRVRLSDSELDDLQRASNALIVSPSTLVRALVRDLVTGARARYRSGAYLVDLGPL